MRKYKFQGELMLITRASGNELVCLAQKGYKTVGAISGSSIYSLGVIDSLSNKFKTGPGVLLEQATQAAQEGRSQAYQRLLSQVDSDELGVVGIVSRQIVYPGYLEFLLQASVVSAADNSKKSFFSTDASGQEFFAQLDAGYQPRSFVTGTSVYSNGQSQKLLSGLKILAQGEIKDYSDTFNQTRLAVFKQIIAAAKAQKANAVVGIKTLILPYGKACEMSMSGTACYNTQLADVGVVTSGLSQVEMWHLAKMGYAPLQLVLATTVYSIGLVGNIVSSVNSYLHGEIKELSSMVAEAREKTVALIQEEANKIGADNIVGLKTYTNSLGNGLVEFLAIGTAVKKLPDLRTESDQLPSQVIAVDESTFYHGMVPLMGSPNAPLMRILLIVAILFFFVWLYLKQS